MHYEVLGDPIFREREVPRTLELATARPGGEAGMPDDLRRYPARSAAGKRWGNPELQDGRIAGLKEGLKEGLQQEFAEGSKPGKRKRE
jgi:hypothetical protein